MCQVSKKVPYIRRHLFLLDYQTQQRMLKKEKVKNYHILLLGNLVKLKVVVEPYIVDCLYKSGMESFRKSKNERNARKDFLNYKFK